MTATLCDDTACALGEGPLRHPERGHLFWFGVAGMSLLTRTGGGTRRWRFPRRR